METRAAARSVRLPQLAKYEVLEEIGHGGMATVYRARDKRLGREVAVKVIHPHLRDSREVVARFNAEARAVAKLKHPNIVEVYDVSEADEDEQYLVVEFVRGTTLRKLLQEHGAMPPEVAAAIALELIGALSHAHAAGVVHRDVKPENVLVEKRDTVIVKLTDFGIAKLLDAQGVTSTGQVLGSPAHMAPEQIEGGDVDGRADVFGLGVLLYECMVGHLPFEGNNPAQVLRRVLDGRYPAAVDERAVVGVSWNRMVDRALAHTPEDRFVDCNAMRGAIATELKRLGVLDPRAETKQWMDNPAAYETALSARMIERLCALGAEARKRGDPLAAAAEYNRALAHAPHDPLLLRIVAGMQRTEARARALRRASAALLLMTGLGLVAFGVGKLVKGARIRPDSSQPRAAASLAPPGPSVAFVASVETPSAPSVAPSASAPAPVRVILPLPLALPRSERTITLDLQPPMGVKLSIDGAPPRDVSTGSPVPLDTKAHVLTLSCDVCTPVQRSIPPGDKDDTIVVSIPIQPATLVVEGDVGKTYQIVERPEIAVRAGVNTVPMSRTFVNVTVRQIETDSRAAVKLQAGKTAHAPF